MKIVSSSANVPSSAEVDTVDADGDAMDLPPALSAMESSDAKTEDMLHHSLSPETAPDDSNKKEEMASSRTGSSTTTHRSIRSRRKAILNVPRVFSYRSQYIESDTSQEYYFPFEDHELWLGACRRKADCSESKAPMLEKRERDDNNKDSSANLDGISVATSKKSRLS